MIGSLDPRIREVTVIGGGIAGLLAAHALTRKGYEVTLHEASARLGGLIETKATPFGIAESAAHSLLATPAVLELCAELGVELLPVRQGSHARYISRGGKLRRFPLGLRELAGLLWHAFRPAPAVVPGTAPLTLAEWADRHLGRAAREYLLNPFLRGIYAARPEELALEAAFPQLAVPPGRSLAAHLLALRRAHRGPRALMMAPRHGMGALIEALERDLRAKLGSRLRTGSALTELPAHGNVVVCVPATPAAALLERESPALAAALQKITYSAMTSVTVFTSCTARIRGVGVLNPEIEGRGTLGILFNSAAFENRVSPAADYASFTAMLAGVELTEVEIRDRIRNDFRFLLGIDENLAHIEITRWARAIPRYDHALVEAWSLARTALRPGLVLFGNYSGPVSLRGMIEATVCFPPSLQGK